MDSFAIAAFVISILAFVIACFQGLLDYMSSNSSRNKCNRVAIGHAQWMVKWGWSWLWWHLRVYYPVLNFDAEILLAQQVALYKDSIKTIELSELLSEPERYQTLDGLALKENWVWRELEIMTSPGGVMLRRSNTSRLPRLSERAVQLIP